MRALVAKNKWSRSFMVALGALVVAGLFAAYSELYIQPNRRASFSMKILPFATFCSAIFTPLFYLLISKLKLRGNRLILDLVLIVSIILTISYAAGWAYFGLVANLPFVPNNLHSFILQELLSISMPFWLVIFFLMFLMRSGRDATFSKNPATEATVKSLTASHGSHVYSVGLKDITWAKAEGNYVKLFTKERFYLKHVSLKNVLEMDQQQLIRVHKSHLVNVNFVESYKNIGHGDLKVRLTTGDTVKCSRNYAGDFKYLLQQQS